MKLEFNSTAELSEFLEFSRLLGGLLTEAKANVMMHVNVATGERLDELAAIRAHDTALPEALAELEEAQGNEPAPTEQPEPKKRTRRTKAEMEAARAAEALPQSEPLTGSPNVGNVGSNPFEAATSETSSSTATEAILNAPNGQAATLAGIAAMQTQSPFDPAPAPSHSEPVVQTAPVTAPTAAQAEPVAVGDAATFLETRSLELLTAGEPIKTVEHMHKCRDFIAKHGQAKYLESFPLAGLTATIGTFKPEQCARHQAALEFLSANA